MKKSRLGHLAMIAEMLSSGTNSNFKGGGLYEPEKKSVKPLPPKGKLFVIQGIEIYALNKKNAVRKYDNLKNKV